MTPCDVVESIGIDETMKVLHQGAVKGVVHHFDEDMTDCTSVSSGGCVEGRDATQLTWRVRRGPGSKRQSTRM